jgi:DNA-binding response OmpR family regulator
LREPDHGRGHDEPFATRRYSILVVEDDPTISDLLAYNLRRAGYDARQERSGTAGLEAALAGEDDLVLLDLMLPGLDGISAAREIRRRRPDLPMIMLTARDDRETVLRGFEAGADDFVTKPFDMDVLLARIQARLRAGGGTPAERGPLHLGNATLDPDDRTLSGSATTVELKPREYDLMELFLTEPGRLLPREEIVERVWHHRYLAGSRSLDVHIRRLRRKLAQAGCDVHILTTRGVGYRTVQSTPHDEREAHESRDDQGSRDERGGLR